MIRVLQFADIVNRHDFIDTVVQHADRCRFKIDVCVRSELNNIEDPVYESRTRRWVLNGESKSDFSLAAIGLAAILRESKTDILHAHHYEQAILGWLATRIYRKTRLIIGRHYSDAIYRLPSPFKRRALLQLEALVNRAAQRIIVPSSQISEILTNRQQLNDQKVDVIPYAFEPSKYSSPPTEEISCLRQQLGIDGYIAFGTFARLHEEKGHRFLLQAIKDAKDKLAGTRFLLVGDGPEREALARQIHQSDLAEIVKLVGWRRDAISLISAVDAVVQPTLQEAFSQVMVEALWMRKPLIITDVSGATDIISHNENGLIVPKADTQALAQTIHRVAADAELRARLGHAGRLYVTQNLTAEQILPRYEQAYMRALES